MYGIRESHGRVDEILDEYTKFLEQRTYHHLGYPYNLDYEYQALHKLVDFSINNLGDPFIESNYGVHSRRFETAVLDYFAEMWGLAQDEYWGYMTACGTEGNLHGIYLGRENLSDSCPQDNKIALVASHDSHYSIWKAARMFVLEPHPIASQDNGEIDYTALSTTLHALKTQNKRVIFVANIGTTIKGAIDDVNQIFQLLKETGYTQKDSFVHLDGALAGMMIPFMTHPDTCPISFKQHPIGSISVSGHKFLGSPVPCGIVITRKDHIHALASNISYIASRDATILGSRNGHAPVFLWYALVTKGQDGLKRDVESCLENATYLKHLLVESGVKHVMLNEMSSTVVFTKPKSQEFIKKWQLACDGDICHVVVMPNIQKEKIDEFVAELILEM